MVIRRYKRIKFFIQNKKVKIMFKFNSEFFFKFLKRNGVPS